MVIVIADDFSGAAEIAGIGRQYGMTVELQTHFSSDSTADLLVIDTNSRLCSAADAAVRIKELVERIKAAAIEIAWIYKKTDSVLRGPITAELQALLEALEHRRVLLVPANPSRGRVIREGQYFIADRLLGETDFANDAEYPVSSSHVIQLLGFGPASNSGLLRRGMVIPEKGIWVAEAETNYDCRTWAQCIDEYTIPAGAADFFTAILQVQGRDATPFKEQRFRDESLPALFIFGSTSDYSRKMLRNTEQAGCRICRMPFDAFRFKQNTKPHIDQWASEIETALKKDNCVIAVVDQPGIEKGKYASKLSVMTAAMVYKVLSDLPRCHLYIEGGATASAIIRKSGWVNLEVSRQVDAGVVEMRVAENPHQILTVKPGSYSWSQTILEILMKGKSCAN